MNHRMEKCRRVLAMLFCAVLLAGLMPAGALAEEGEACVHDNTCMATENVVGASCILDGTHDEVMYCTNCGAELNRTTITDYAMGHTAGETVTENAFAASCTQDGSHDEVTYCTNCGTELSHVTVTDYAAGHSPGQTVTENAVIPTEEADGRHDEVVYCTVCNAELSRVTVTDPKPEKTMTAGQQQEELQKAPAAEQETEEQHEKEPEQPEETQEDAPAAPKLGATRGTEMGMHLVIIFAYSPHGRVGIVEPSQYGASLYYESETMIDYSIMSGSRLRLYAVPDAGYDFTGWHVYLLDSNGTEIAVAVDEDGWFVVPDGTTSRNVYIAAYFEEPPTPVFYNVVCNSVDQETHGKPTNCQVTVKNTAQAGETVTVNLVMQPGTCMRQLDGRDITITWHEMVEGREILRYLDYTKVDDTTYTFVMPAADVRVYAEFTFINYSITPEPLTNGQTARIAFYRTSRDDPKYFIGAGYCNYNAASGGAGDVQAWVITEGFENWTAQYGDTVYLEMEMAESSSDYAPLTLSLISAANGSTVIETIEAQPSGSSGRFYTASTTMPNESVIVRVNLTPCYAISAAAIEHGTILHSQTRARADDVIEVEADPDDPTLYGDFQWNASWTDAQGETHELELTFSTVNHLQASFVMPAGPVYLGGELLPKIPYYLRGWSGSAVSANQAWAAHYTLMSDVRDDDDTRLSSGIYVARGNVTFDERIELAEGAEVTLILCDGASLKMEKGIGVNVGSTLTICGQTEDSGILNAKAKSGAPIGADSGKDSGEVEIHGGHVIATTKGENPAAAIGGAKDHAAGGIRIYGGLIDATSKYSGAGIGSGEDSGSADILILGGVVNAEACDGAAIGGGCTGLYKNVSYGGGPIEIWGGEVNAYACGAGIGAGNNVQNPKITIKGGRIKAICISNGESGAGIGAGRYADQLGDITITGGEVIAISQGGAGIGAGAWYDGGKITITGGIVEASSTNGGAGIGGGRKGGDGGTVTIEDATVVAVGLKTNEGDEMLDRFSQMAQAFSGGNHSQQALAGAAMFEIVGAIIYLTSDDESGAGIGGGYNGVGGSVSITNSYVAASAATGKARAIGHGTGKSNPGDLYLDPMATVYTGKDQDHAAYTPYEEREDACQSNRFALILPCQHEEGTYIVTADTHQLVCPNCSLQSNAVSHIWDASGKTCSVCGYRLEEIRTIQFKANGGSGAMADINVVRGEKYTLPKCSFTAPSNAAFLEWEVQIGDASPVRMTTNESFTVTANTIVKPVWGNQYTVTFDSDGSSEVAAQSFLAGSTVAEPDDPVKEGYRFKGWYLVTNNGELADEPYDFTSPVYTNITLKAVWEEFTKTVINGVTGSFNEKIKLNFYFGFPSAVLEDEKAYVTLTNGNTRKMETQLITDAGIVRGKGYKFSIELAAKEVSDPIIAKVYDGQGNELTIMGESGTEYTESGVQKTLMEYFEWLADPNSNSTAEEKALGAAAKDYCAGAKIYFGYNADGMSVSSAVTGLSEEILSGYTSVRSGDLPEGVSIRGISAMLEADNTLRLYLNFDNVDPDDFIYKIDGKTARLKQRADGARYLAMYEGVWPNRLQDAHSYSVSDGPNTYTITASVLAYARACALRTNENESNLGKALYLYNQAAVAAFGE